MDKMSLHLFRSIEYVFSFLFNNNRIANIS